MRCPASIDVIAKMTIMIGAVTPHEFNIALTDLNLSQAGLRRIIERLSGERIGNVTVNRWAAGRANIPPTAVTILRLLAMLPKTKRDRLALRKSRHTIGETTDATGLSLHR